MIQGHPRLNLAFVANLFNTYPALDVVEDIELPEEILEETREEKSLTSSSLPPFYISSIGVELDMYRVWVIIDI